MRAIATASVALLMGFAGSLPAFAQDTQTFRYDAHGRLVGTATAYTTNSAITTYSFDAAENRNQRGEFPMGMTPTPDRLMPNYNMVPAMQLASASGVYQLVFEQSGNLVLKTSSTTVWTSQTANGRGLYLQMQTDGNLVLIDPAYSPVWASGTAGNPGAYLVLGNDGVARVMNSAGTATLWCTAPSC